MPKLRLADKTVHMCAQKRLCCVYWKCIGVFEVSASLIWSSGKPSGTSEYALFKLVPMIWLNHRSLTKVLFSNINITVQKLIRSVQLFLSYGVRGRGVMRGQKSTKKCYGWFEWTLTRSSMWRGMAPYPKCLLPSSSRKSRIASSFSGVSRSSWKITTLI